MVFGWGRRERRPEPRPRPGRELGLDEVAAAADEAAAARAAAAAAEAADVRARLEPILAELASIASELDGDGLDLEDADKRIRVTVERGKRQIVSAIRGGTAEPLPQAGSAAGAAELAEDVGRRLRHMGDALGRHTKSIHAFGKRYAKRIKAALEEAEELHRRASEVTSGHAAAAAAAASAREGVEAVRAAEADAEAKSGRAAELEGMARGLEGEIGSLRGREEEMTSSPGYAEYEAAVAEMDALEGRGRELRRRTNDSFTKVSRPIAKYAYVSSLEKPQRRLLESLAADPYAALASAEGDVAEVLAAVRRGVASGSVSVKDPAKAEAALAEMASEIPALARAREEHEEGRRALEARAAAAFDSAALDRLRSEAAEAAARRDEYRSRAARLSAEAEEARGSAASLLGGVERDLRAATSVSYTVRR